MPAPGSLMQGKKGLIMGVANDRSSAWGIARLAAQHGAELAFTFQGEALERRVRPIAATVGAPLVLPCDVTDDASLDATFAAIAKQWGRLDFAVHAIAFSDKEQLKGKYVATTRDNFTRTLDISCFSFTDVCRRASALMDKGGNPWSGAGAAIYFWARVAYLPLYLAGIAYVRSLVFLVSCAGLIMIFHQILF